MDTDVLPTCCSKDKIMKRLTDRSNAQCYCHSWQRQTITTNKATVISKHSAVIYTGNDILQINATEIQLNFVQNVAGCA